MKWRFFILFLSISTASFFFGCEADVSIDGEDHHVVITDGSTGVFGTSTWGNTSWGK